jgi:hypothetical protein
MTKFKRMWHVHTPGSTRQKVKLDAYEYDSTLRSILNANGSILRTMPLDIVLVDERYYLPPFEDGAGIVRASTQAALQYRDETHDCDDYSRELLGAFGQAAYADGRQREPFAVGMLHCMFADRAEDGEAGAHALNFMLTEDKKLWIIEPQTNELFLLDRRVQYAWFIYS